MNIKKHNFADLNHISLARLETELQADRSTVRRWLAAAGVRPVALGNGRNGAIRYRRSEIDQWLRSRERVL